MYEAYLNVVESRLICKNRNGWTDVANDVGLGIFPFSYCMLLLMVSFPFSAILHNFTKCNKMKDGVRVKNISAAFCT